MKPWSCACSFLTCSEHPFKYTSSTFDFNAQSERKWFAVSFFPTTVPTFNLHVHNVVEELVDVLLVVNGEVEVVMDAVVLEVAVELNVDVVIDVSLGVDAEVADNVLVVDELPVVEVAVDERLAVLIVSTYVKSTSDKSAITFCIEAFASGSTGPRRCGPCQFPCSNSLGAPRQCPSWLSFVLLVSLKRQSIQLL